MMKTYFFSFSFDFQTDGEHPFSQGQSMDQEQGLRKQQYNEMGEGRIVEGLSGDKMAREGRVASDDPPDVGDEI
jgi:hypothetical protein